jgi:hypothetical protein
MAIKIKLFLALLVNVIITNAYWSDPLLYITSPPQIAGEYRNILTSSFTPFPNGDLVGNLSLADPILGCDNLTKSYAGKICLLERGILVGYPY